MSRFSLLCSLLVFAASAAKAVMIGWNLPAVDDDILNSTVYVYASSAQVDAYSAGSKTWTDSGKSTFEGKLENGSLMLTTNASDIAGFSEGLSVWANLGTLTDDNNNYYYYLVFVANGDGNADSGGTYAIAGAQYVQGTNKNGFYDVEADSDPDYVGEFADLSWIAANHKSAPEPTVLALLALGFAGLALRRKVA